MYLQHLLEDTEDVSQLPTFFAVQLCFIPLTAGSAVVDLGTTLGSRREGSATSQAVKSLTQYARKELIITPQPRPLYAARRPPFC